MRNLICVNNTALIDKCVALIDKCVMVYYHNG